jgi:hypothetical protein
MFKIKTITIINNEYYNKNNCQFVLCDFCYWFATILKDVDKFNYCPRCKKKKLYTERILRL